jgi:transposase
MTIPIKEGGRPSKRPSNEELAMLYSSMTAKQVAEHYGVSEFTVRNWINKARKEEPADDKRYSK